MRGSAHNRPIISAGEINKYAYCPLQWYYIRVYGEKELRKRYREMFGENTAANASYNRGKAFHKNYLGYEARKAVIRWVLAALLAAAVLYILLKP